MLRTYFVTWSEADFTSHYIRNLRPKLGFHSLKIQKRLFGLFAIRRSHDSKQKLKMEGY